ncbi:MAG: hypothetical protein K2P78_14695 [Gemmataceae bacterium]|nr:hypothetical protein [Gemmataceae bacterium]
MKTLDEAWAWYEAVSNGTNQLARLAKYWQRIPWAVEGEVADVWVTDLANDLVKDHVLRHLEPEQMRSQVDTVMTLLDDLAVLLLFSVFESNVRDLILVQIRPEIDALKHPALTRAVEDVVDNLKEGSFFRVLELFKAQGTDDLVEHVNQVRQYRNWVAHGRRPEKKKDRAEVEPKAAYQRLTAFLEVVRAAAPDDES